MVKLYSLRHTPLFRRMTALVLGLVFSTGQMFAQNITLNIENAPISTILQEIQSQSNYRFVYNSALVNVQATASVSVQNASLETVLETLFEGTGIAYETRDNQIVLRQSAYPPPQQVRYQEFTGRVIDDITREGLPFATVRIQGTTTGTVTSIDGDFSITAPANAILVFSYTGFENVEIAASALGAMGQIRMRMSATTLEGVVITGFQTIARERVTGSVSMISSDALETRFNQNLMQNLEGRVAGLVIDSEGNATIRGMGSLHAVNRPLLVVDGMPIEGSIEDLNPFDIESVTVLKDAAAAAMYGARASAGIIVVTTRRAREFGTSINVSANFTLSQRRNVNYADNFFLTPAQQVDMESSFWLYDFIEGVGAHGRRAAFANQFLDRNWAVNPIQFAYWQLGEGLINQRELNDILNELRQNNYAQEFSDHILRNQFVQQYNVAIHNRSDNYAQSLVLNLRSDNGGMIHERDNRFNISYRGDLRATRWLNVDFGVNTVIQRTNTFNSEFSPANNPFSERAYARLFNPDGSLANNSRTERLLNVLPNAFRSTHYNAFEELALDRTNIDRNSSRYHAGLTFRIKEGLSIQIQGVYEEVRLGQRMYSPSESHLMRIMRNEHTMLDTIGNWQYLIGEHGGRLATQNIRESNWTARGQVNYARVFRNRHSIDFLAGLEFRETLRSGTTGLLMGFDDQLQMSNPMLNYEDLRRLQGTQNFDFGQRTINTTGFLLNGMGLIRETHHRFASGYTNITYTLDERYNAFASFRRDFADVYGLDSEFRGTPLWSVGLSWIASRENFMRGVRWVDHLKIRGSYGLTGNIHLGTTSIMTATILPIVNEHNRQPQATVDNPGNPFLTWERTRTTNIGIDYGLFASRLRGSLDWYYRQGDDVFSHKVLESTFGFPSMFMNNASLFNQGVELVVAYDWFIPRTRDHFGWTTSLTAAYNYNRVTQVDLIANTAQALVNSRFREGFASSVMWAYRFGGLDEIGRLTYIAPDGSRVSRAEITGMAVEALAFAGQSDPKLTMGIENSFRFRGFSLNILMIYWGGHVMRALPAGYYSFPLAHQPMPSWLLRAWTPENPDTDVPALWRSGQGATLATDYSDIYVHPADFLKIRNASLTYDIPHEWTNRLGIHRAQVRFQLDNPPALWVRNNVGVDPETINNPMLNGVRRPTSFIFGLNFNF